MDSRCWMPPCLPKMNVDQPWGEQRAVRNHYNELALTLQQTADQRRKLRIIFRVFDDAIAFRYEWPEQAGLKGFDIMDELTEFVLPADHLALWQPAFRPQHTNNSTPEPG